MRIHTDRLTLSDIYSAALIARASVEVTEHGSRSRARAFNVHLTGESKRRPNRQGNGNADDYAATWDQWGVFLAVLFQADDERTFDVSRPMFTPYDESAEHFAARTGDRFGAPEDVMLSTGYTRQFKVIEGHWPADYHGDHTFRYAGTPHEQSCTKCEAVQRWGARVLDYVS